LRRRGLAGADVAIESILSDFNDLRRRHAALLADTARKDAERDELETRHAATVLMMEESVKNRKAVEKQCAELGQQHAASVAAVIDLRKQLAASARRKFPWGCPHGFQRTKRASL
jgi:3-oxoacyl-ACP reductase-like protein